MTPVQEQLLARAADDWVMFHEVVDLVREEAPGASEDQLVDRVLDELAPLLRGGQLVVGDVGATGFVPWPSGLAAALTEILGRWRGLPREPNLGDVCWFDIRARRTTASGTAG